MTGAGADGEGSATVVDLIEARVDADPAAVAVVGDDRRITFAELDENANRIAHAIGRADPTRRHAYGGVLVGTGAWPIVAMVGVVKSGRAVTGLDGAAPPERLQEVADQLGSMVVVADAAHREGIGSRPADVVLEEMADDLPTTRPRVPIDVDDGFSVHFTSGSTGRPKGALRTHRAQARGALNHRGESGYRPGLQVALVHDVAFAASRSVIWGSLVDGATIHVRDVRAHGPWGLASWLAERRIGVLAAPAPLVEAMVALDPPSGVLEDLERLAFAGEVLRVETLRRVVPYLRPDALLRNSYGSSEMGLVASLAVRADALPRAELMPAGPPRDGLALRIVAPDDQGVGEIVVSGPKVAVRYVDDATDERGSFVEQGGHRWFRSGDLGRLRPDGMLEVRGRLDDRVKLRSQTIDPSEIELALRDRADVADVFVGLRSVGGRDGLVAWIGPVPGATPTVTEVRRDLRAHLPDWMIPQRVVVLDRLPRTERGKVDRAALPLPGAARPDLEVAHAMPRTPMEQRLAEAFGAVLGVEGVGRDDPFFDLGGDSLAAAELVDHVSRALGRDLPMDAFLDAATPAALAARLQADPQGPDDRLVDLQPGGDGVPLVLVHAGHGFVVTYGHLAEALAVDRPVHGLQMLTTDPARDLFDLEALARRYADLLDRRLPGPVLVAGFSGGSLLAHALTAELVARGREVPACVLLDPVGVRAPRRRVKALAYGLLARTGVRLRPDRATQQRMATMAVGARRYRPGPVPVPIVVARSVLARPERWGPLTAAEVTVVDVPGGHESMLYPPHSGEVGRALRPRLADLDERVARGGGSARSGGGGGPAEPA